MKKKLLSLLNAYKKACEKSDKLDKEWDADPSNEKIEAAWDAAYKAEFAAFEALVDALVKLTGGKIKPAVARAMVRTKLPEIEALVSKLA